MNEIVKLWCVLSNWTDRSHIYLNCVDSLLKGANLQIDFYSQSNKKSTVSLSVCAYSCVHMVYEYDVCCCACVWYMCMGYVVCG